MGKGAVREGKVMRMYVVLFLPSTCVESRSIFIEITNLFDSKAIQLLWINSNGMALFLQLSSGYEYGPFIFPKIMSLVIIVSFKK